VHRRFWMSDPTPLMMMESLHAWQVDMYQVIVQGESGLEEKREPFVASEAFVKKIGAVATPPSTVPPIQYGCLQVFPHMNHFLVSGLTKTLHAGGCCSSKRT